MRSHMSNELEPQQSTEDRSHPQESMQELLDRLGKETNGDHVVRLFPPISLRSYLQFEIETTGEVTKPTPDSQLANNWKAIDSCDCTSCSNKRSISELINKYENQKVRMITELDDLKSNSDQIEAQTSELNARIVAYADSISAGGSILAALQGKTNAIAKEQQNLGGGDFCPSQQPGQTLQEDIRTLQAYRNVLNNHIMSKSATQTNPAITELNHQDQTPIRTETNLKVQPQLEVQLEKALEDNLYMVRKIKDLESTFNAICGTSNHKIAADTHHQNATASEEKGSLTQEDSALQKLKLMKDAYVTNQNLIVVQKEQLHSQRHLISKYEDFARDLHRWFGSVLSNSGEAISENVDLSHTLDYLRGCLRHVLTSGSMTSKKLEAVQQVLTSANRENALLNETVASLNDHIEELSQEHDKLVMEVKEFQFNHTNCMNCSHQFPALSTSSTPRTDEVSQAAELEEKIGDDVRYLYSFSPHIPPPPTSSSSESESASPLSFQEGSFPINAPCEPETCGISNSTESCVNNLKLMAKCLRDLKNSSMILSPSSLNSPILLPTGP